MKKPDLNHDMVQYYAARAKEYEKLYARPERQGDLNRLSTIIQDIFRSKHVLELACGTGWWTQRLAQTASEIVAMDINEPMLDVARAKLYEPAPVQFRCEDLYKSELKTVFEGVLTGYMWSHVLLEELPKFLTRCFSWTEPGGLVVFIDNRFVPANSTPIYSTDEKGNTYQLRQLDDHSSHVVLKNFPTPDFLRKSLEPYARYVEVLEFDYYWIAICQAA